MANMNEFSYSWALVCLLIWETIIFSKKKRLVLEC